MQKGLDPGGALIFLLLGPATNLSNLVVLKKYLGIKGLLMNLISLVFVAFLFSGIIDFYYSVKGQPDFLLVTSRYSSLLDQQKLEQQKLEQSKLGQLKPLQNSGLKSQGQIHGPSEMLGAKSAWPVLKVPLEAAPKVMGVHEHQNHLKQMKSANTHISLVRQMFGEGRQWYEVLATFLMVILLLQAFLRENVFKRHRTHIHQH
jgi:hypothetical protein